jgi:hypothetical protein
VQSVPGALVLGFASNGLTFVVLGTVAFSLVMSLLFLVTRGSDSMYDHIGQGGISREGDEHGTGRTAAEPGAVRSEQEQEIRQMLRARSDRRVSRGEQPLDIDAEVARLLEDRTTPDHDPALVAEVRQLVAARNERRARQGLEPLDVDAEVARTLAELASGDGGV